MDETGKGGQVQPIWYRGILAQLRGQRGMRDVPESNPHVEHQEQFETWPACDIIKANGISIYRRISTEEHPYTNTNKEKIGLFFSRALAYVVNDFPR